MSGRSLFRWPIRHDRHKRRPRTNGRNIETVAIAGPTATIAGRIAITVRTGPTVRIDRTVPTDRTVPIGPTVRIDRIGRSAGSVRAGRNETPWLERRIID